MRPAVFTIKRTAVAATAVAGLAASVDALGHGRLPGSYEELVAAR